MSNATKVVTFDRIGFVGMKNKNSTIVHNCKKCKSRRAGVEQHQMITDFVCVTSTK